jgi:hypothetical protein
VFLRGINWLAAATAPSVMDNSGWQQVGYGPIIFGIPLLLLGVGLILSYLYSETDAGDSGS